MENINDTIILELFQATLSVDSQVRQQSEFQLKELSKVPGFLQSCCAILTTNYSPGSEHNANGANLVFKETKIAISVFLKNLINKTWAESDIELDRAFLKQNFVQILTNCEYNIKKQLLTSLRVIIQHEAPQWMEILYVTKTMLESVGIHQFTVAKSGNEEIMNKVFTAVLIISEVARYYKYTTNTAQAELDWVLKQFFPALLVIGDILFQDSQNLTEYKAEILKLIFKSYKFVTYLDFPPYLQEKDNIIKWGQLHGQVISMKIPDYIISSGYNEYEKNQLQISKVMKWALTNVNRIIVRYINTSRPTAKTSELRRIYLHEYLPYLLKSLFTMIEEWCGKTRWINLSTLYAIIDVLKNCLNFKHLWLEIKEILPSLIEYFLFPNLLLDDHKIEVFNNDPYEYIQLIFTVFLDGNNKNSPDFAAISFIQTLVSKRKKSSLDLIINICYQRLYTLLQVQPETLETAKEKEAFLRILGSMTDNLINNQNNKYYDSMEDILMNLILPNLNSNFKFLTARTFEIVGHFSDLEFKSPDNLNRVIYETLKNFGLNGHEVESNLVVNLENALCIQSYLHIDEFKESLSFIILPVMSKLLEISNEVDNDTISVVMQECVENFGEQLQPFGTELVYKLVDSFMRSLSEQQEQEQDGVQEGDGDYDNDKVIAGIGILNTIITVLLSFDNDKIIIRELTKILVPLVNHILATENEHFVGEICEIVENLVYLNKQITPELFGILKLLDNLINSDIGVLYFEEVMPSLKNYLIYYPEPRQKATMLDETQIKEIDEIFMNIFCKSNSKLDNLNDLILNFELVQYFVLMLKLDSVKYFKFIIEQLIPMFKYLDKDQLKSFESSLLFQISFLNVFISMLIYDSNFVIFQLKDNFGIFLGHWFKLIPRITRTYDIKLSILGLISLINNNNLNITMEFSDKLVHLLKKLPLAMKELNKKRKPFDFNNLDELYEFTQGEGPSVTDNVIGAIDDRDEDSDSDDDIINEDHSQYLDFLNQENMKLVEEDIIEDPMETTPLDHTNLHEILQNFLRLLKINNQVKFHKLFGGFTSEELERVIKV